VHGRARHEDEAARRRKSECKVNLDYRKSYRSNSLWQMTTKTVSQNHAWRRWRMELDVFCPPKFRGRAFGKLYARYHPCFMPRRLEKFHEDIPTSPEVIGGAYAEF